MPLTRLHDLRHTHASLLIKNLVPLKVVSKRLGRAKASFTMDTYRHVMPGMQGDAAPPTNRSSGHLGVTKLGQAPPALTRVETLTISC